MANLQVALDDVLVIEPKIAWGEAAVIDLPQLVSGRFGTAAVDITAWTVAVSASFVLGGAPDATLSGVTVAKTGVRSVAITVPAAVTAAFTEAKTLYLTVWRTDAGYERPMRTVSVGTYPCRRS